MTCDCLKQSEQHTTRPRPITPRACGAFRLARTIGASTPEWCADCAHKRECHAAGAAPATEES